jgi:hypothetical protein
MVALQQMAENSVDIILTFNNKLIATPSLSSTHSSGSSSSSNEAKGGTDARVGVGVIDWHHPVYIDPQSLSAAMDVAIAYDIAAAATAAASQPSSTDSKDGEYKEMKDGKQMISVVVMGDEKRSSHNNSSTTSSSSSSSSTVILPIGTSATSRIGNGINIKQQRRHVGSWLEYVLDSSNVYLHRGAVAARLVATLIAYGVPTLCHLGVTIERQWSLLAQRGDQPKPENITIPAYNNLLEMCDGHTRRNATMRASEPVHGPCRRMRSYGFYVTSRIATVLAPQMARETMNVFIMGCHSRIGAQSSIYQHFQSSSLFDKNVTLNKTITSYYLFTCCYM